MKTVILATNNAHKVSEISTALDFPGWEFKTLREMGIESDPVEDDDTFLGNARIKALAAHEASGGMAALADDSGLVVDALGGAPGVYSSRFAGEDATDDDNNAKLLADLAQTPDDQRTARFVCTLVFIDEDGSELFARGTVEGRIGHGLQGDGGFGYDPLFWPDVFGGMCTLAEVPQARKNEVSHRGNALRELRARLGESLGLSETGGQDEPSDSVDQDVDALSVAQARAMMMEGEQLGASTAPSGLGDAEELSGQEVGAEAVSFGDGAVGLGVDIVEIERMARILERSPAFAERVFSQAERTYCQSKANAATHFALRFAAKEAVVKALGTGFSEGIWVHDIEVERAKNGKPSVKLQGRALEVAREQGVREISISLSYTHTDAVACAMAVTEASVRASEQRRDPMEELTKQFKEMRGMLDEL